jgi:hypothetical protein
LAAVLISGACAKSPQVTRRTVTLNVPKACASGPLALDGTGYAVYHALGDFDPQGPLPTGHVVGAIGQNLPELDDATRALVVDVTQHDRQWMGTAGVPATGDVDLMLLPSLTSCGLSTSVGSRTRSILAPVSGQRVLVVGGIPPRPTDASPATYLARLDTGGIDVVIPTQDISPPRILASVTVFGDGALVAGGLDPSFGGLVQGKAEVYSPSLGGFDQQHPIILSAPRQDHGAAVLATGETLLVGGVGADGTVLDSMEVVDPVTRTVRAVNVARLAVARRTATVLRLASGEILVAGGFDAGNGAVPTIEWFSHDASKVTKQPRVLVVDATNRAYVALAGGGALAVVAPPPGAPPDFQNVWVIDADGAIEAATPIAGSLSQPVLFGGAGGAPVLWTGDRWLRWQPWSGAFGALGALDDTPAHVGDATTSPDGGLALWLDAGKLTALRFDVRGEYSPLPGPLAVTDAGDMAPDRLAASGAVAFDPALGLVMAPGASAFVTDRTYADVTLDVDAPTGEPALVVLRDGLGGELEIGGVACPVSVAPGPSSLDVRRTGATVTWTLSSGASGACSGALPRGARVSVGVRGKAGASRSVVRNLRVARQGAP